MSYFLKNGNTFRVTSKDAMDLHEALPAGNYVVKVDNNGIFFLEQIDGFVAPRKIYGDCLKNTDRVIRTFLSRDNSTGVMLTGEKGSGKTLLSKNISIKLAEQDVPTIVVNAPFKGDSFNTFLQTIDQPCVILFDEFEKVYDRDDQEAILTLLDGVFPSKKLFILTCNDKYRVDQHMRNRPGRIFYLIDFKGLSAEFIAEYCQDNLDEKEHIEKIITIASLFGEFNFDMLKALVEEMNRYGETPADALTILNAKPEFDNGCTYDVVAYLDGAKIEHDIHPDVFAGNPLQPAGIHVSFDGNPGDDSSEWIEERFQQNDLLKVDARAGTFVFEKDKVRIVLSRQKQKYFSYDAI